MTEKATVLQAREGNQDAFYALYEEHRENVFRQAYRYTRSVEDAEDILQETFIKAFKGLKTFDPDTGAGFSAWILKIGLRCALDHLRRMKRRKGADHVPLAELFQEPVTADPAPAEALVARQTREWIHAVRRSLPPRQQAAFELRYGRHLAIKEIAARMDCSESNIKTQLARAVAKLRKRIEPAWGKL